MPRALFLVALLALSAGCSTTQPISTSTPVTRTEIKLIDKSNLKIDYAHERQFLSNKEERPKLGLALSGGGTKAGMFAHGVLHGLQNARILQQVDVISTVSGGGYAALWYYTKLLEAPRQGFAVASIFADCLPRYWTYPPRDGDESQLDTAMVRAQSNLDPSRINMPVRQLCTSYEHYGQNDEFRWQAHLVRWPDVFGTTPVTPTGDPQNKPESAIRAGIFDGLLLEPVLQLLGRRGSSIPDLYQSGIERAWGLNPAPRSLHGQKHEQDKWTYTNGIPAQADNSAGPWRLDPKTVTWTGLRALHANAANTPSAPKIPLWIVNTNADNKRPDPHTNLSHNFELTAFGSGGPQHGYVNDIDTPPIPDLATAVRASAGFADAQGLAGWKRTALEIIAGIVPGARWGVPVKVPSIHGPAASLRLSDGGGADNLGLLSLLKRGVQDIIVVDAAEDVDGDMSDLCALRTALAEDQITLAFPDLQDLGGVCDGNKRYNVSDWPNPVVQGTATWSNGMVSRIWLIKAAWDQRWVADTYTENRCGEPGWADCFLATFYGHNSTIGVHGPTEGLTNMAFPQLPTAGSTANSSTYLFWGYRELGRGIGQYLKLVQGKIERVGEQCTVRAHPATPATKGDRPTALRPKGSKLLCRAEGDSQL